MNIIKLENKSNLRRSFAGNLAKFMKKNELLYYTSLVQESATGELHPFLQIETVPCRFRAARFKGFGRRKLFFTRAHPIRSRPNPRGKFESDSRIVIGKI